MKLIHPLLHALLALFALVARADEKADAVQALIPWILDEQEAFKGIRFADVIAATSGKRVLPIDRADKDDQRILAAIGAALDEVLAAMNAPDSPTRGAKRVNEMSSHFETATPRATERAAGLECDFPKTAAGQVAALRLSRPAARRQSHRTRLLPRSETLRARQQGEQPAHVLLRAEARDEQGHRRRAASHRRHRA